MNSSPTLPPEFEIERFKHQLESRRKMADASREFTVGATRTVLIINGGAAGALLAYVGAHSDIAGALVPALVCFLFGAASPGVASILFYTGQVKDQQFTGAIGEQRTNHFKYAVGLLWFGMGCFVVGGLIAAYAFYK